MSTSKQSNIWVVILAGGSGKRLWPLSRKSFPKQFIDFDDSGSLLSKTIRRASALNNLNEILIVIGKSHISLAEEVLKEFPNVNYSLLIEPEGRNTAPAIFSAAKYIHTQENDSTMLVMPSDHYCDQQTFVDTVENVIELKTKSQLVTLGIKPTSPEVGYGYIHHNQNDDILKKIILFKEKPDLFTAQEYLKTNEFYWNSGINIFDTSHILQEFSKHFIDIDSIDLRFQKSKRIINMQDNEFMKLPNTSIDYAILEKSKHTYTAEFLGEWSDVGSWNSLRGLNNNKENNEIVGSDIYLDDSRNNFIYSKSRTIGLSGLDNVAVIDTPDALLITNLEKRENTHKILDKINSSDKDIFENSNRVYRPWGWYESIDNGANYQVKRIHVYPQEQLSVQKHFHRAERWVVIKGEAEVKVGEITTTYQEGSMISIGKEEIHSLANKTNDEVEIIEVQLGEYLGEDDIVRYSDKYGRE